VSFKLQAIPEAEATLVGQRDLAAGLAALRSALSSPYDVSGAAYDGRALVRVEGMAGSVAYRTAELRARLGGDWQVASGQESAALWREVRDVTAFAGQDGAVWRLSVKPSDGLVVSERLAGVNHRAIFDWGGGLVWLLVGPEVDVRALLPGGHATLVRPVPGMPTPVFQPESPEVAVLTRALRAKFDPRGILNPGITG